MKKPEIGNKDGRIKDERKRKKNEERKKEKQRKKINQDGRDRLKFK